MIPNYPHFKSLELADRLAIEAITRRFPPFSDFNFVSLWCYDTRGTCRISRSDGTLIVRFADYLSGEPFYGFLGDNMVVDTACELLNRAEREGIRMPLRLIPAAVLGPHRRVLQERFTLREDPDSFDYILAIEDMVQSVHPKIGPKWRNMENLESRYADLEVRPIDLRTPTTAEEVVACCARWKLAKRRTDPESDIEMSAIRRCIASATRFDLDSVGAYLGDRMMGFTVNERLQDGFYMAHFGKADPSLKGLGDLLEIRTAQIMRDLGCTRMNFQQDLGLPGLRSYKRSWPFRELLEKVTLTSIPAAQNKMPNRLAPHGKP